MNLPSISIITPSFNQATFIERTIESVLGQNYPDLEYLVIDGGSTDGTVEILEKYSDRIHWVSESDDGQSDAINKGLRIAQGEVVAFLNSDDTYEDGSLLRVGKFFAENPDLMWAYGKCRIINLDDFEIRKPITWYKNLLLRRYSYRKLLGENFISQPATFWRRSVHKEVGYFDEDEHFVMDYEFWLRLGRRYHAGVINAYLANFRMYENSKSGSLDNPQFEDELRVARQYAGDDVKVILLHRFNYFKITTIYNLMARLRKFIG
jgi:glycosyltransferase involved in cell wall biosynthesis